MTNNRERNKDEALREVDILKLVSCRWMFSVPVDRYPDYKVSKQINQELEQFVEGLSCKLVECGSGTGPKQQPIIAFTVKIETNAEETVKKIELYLNSNVVPIV